jgi:Protein of unknown function, DUF488/Hypervirulence associated proteins TUDOR domain
MGKSQTIPTVFTIGHSTRTIVEFEALLQQVSVDLVIDVRSIPRSRTNPQFNADTLPEALVDAGIAYRHLPALGGLRHRKKGAMHSPNTLWRVAAFRNYADYAATDAFRTGLDELRALARDNCCAIMCAEAVWWRCHRRIITDYLLAKGIPVAHIMGPHKIDPAKPTPGVCSLPGGTLVYPAAGEQAKATGRPGLDAAFSLIDEAVEEKTPMGKRFKVGDHVTWNSEAGHVSGKIIKVHTRDVDYKGHMHRANKDEPQYEIKSDKTDHIAMHKGEALNKVNG